MSSENTETRTLALANSRLDATVRGLIGRAQGHGSTVRMLVILVASFAFFTALQPAIFLNPVNLQNIAVASPEIGVISIAMMLAMLTGGIDLSLVAIANLSAITITTLYSQLALTDPEAALVLRTQVFWERERLLALFDSLESGLQRLER